MPMRTRKGVFDPFAAPFHVQLRQPMLHVGRHAQAGLGVLGLTLGFQVAEEETNLSMVPCR